MAPPSLASSYPWTTTPFIANAPMGGFATASLASTITKAGGLGFIGPVFAMPELDAELIKASKLLNSAEPFSKPLTGGKTLPVGLGFLIFFVKLDEAAEVVRKHAPAAIWLFGAHNNADYITWTNKMREVSPTSNIWIQTGSVSSALEIADTCKPDVMVIQGLDAGGHGYEKGAGIISLLPEAADTLAAKAHNIPLIAAGGVVNGRGVAAALALGAQGVVMGTRFLAAEETVISEGFRRGILETRDGGQNTVRDKVFDETRGDNVWPVDYNGRSVVTETYVDLKAGVGLEEIRKRYAEAEKGVDRGFGMDGGKSRSTIWAGTGVGLVNRVQPAAEILKEVLEETHAIVGLLKTRI
jgi:nitronate monooxygenase